MAEPNTTTFVITGAVAAALGPILGPVSLIAFGAIAGSLLAMSKATTNSKAEAFKFVLVGVLIALAITGSAAWALERFMDIPANVALMPVAAVIGAARTTILGLMETLVGLVGSLLSKRGS